MAQGPVRLRYSDTPCLGRPQYTAAARISPSGRDVEPVAQRPYAQNGRPLPGQLHQGDLPGQRYRDGGDLRLPEPNRQFEYIAAARHDRNPRSGEWPG